MLLPALQSSSMILFLTAFASFRFSPSPAHETFDRSYDNLHNHWSWGNGWDIAKGIMNTWISPSQGDIWRKKLICSYRVCPFAFRVHHIVLTCWMPACQWMHEITRTSPCCSVCITYSLTPSLRFIPILPLLLSSSVSVTQPYTIKSTSVPTSSWTGQRTATTSAQSKKTIREKEPEQTSRQGHIWRKQSLWPSCICPRQLSRDSCSISSSWMLNVCIPKSSFTLCNLSLSPAIKYGWQNFLLWKKKSCLAISAEPSVICKLKC